MRLATGGCDVSPFSFRYAPLLCDCHHRIPVDRVRQSGHARAAGARRRRDADCAGRSGKPTPAGDGHLYAGTNADLNTHDGANINLDPNINPNGRGDAWGGGTR